MNERNTTTPISGMKLLPYGSPLTDAAFLGCVHWAASNHEIVDQFMAQTGLSGDNAAGDAEIGAAFAAFADFVCEQIWGIAE